MGGFGVGVGLGMLTFLRLYTCFWKEPIPKIGFLLRWSHCAKDTTASPQVKRKEKQKNTWRWGLGTGMPKHNVNTNVNTTKSVESMVKKSRHFDMYHKEEAKKNLFQGFTK